MVRLYFDLSNFLIFRRNNLKTRIRRKVDRSRWWLNWSYWTYIIACDSNNTVEVMAIFFWVDIEMNIYAEDLQSIAVRRKNSRKIDIKLLIWTQRRHYTRYLCSLIIGYRDVLDWFDMAIYKLTVRIYTNIQLFLGLRIVQFNSIQWFYVHLV